MLGPALGTMQNQATTAQSCCEMRWTQGLPTREQGGEECGVCGEVVGWGGVGEAFPRHGLWIFG